MMAMTILMMVDDNDSGSGDYDDDENDEKIHDEIHLFP